MADRRDLGRGHSSLGPILEMWVELDPILREEHRVHSVGHGR